MYTPQQVVMEINAVMEKGLPRRSVFKVKKKNTNATVKKREEVEYIADRQTITVSSRPQKVKFLVSGDCLMDFQNSFFQLSLSTNTFTAILAEDICSIVKELVIRLPNNSNTVIEHINEYNVLASMLSLVKPDNVKASEWYAGRQCAVNKRRTSTQKMARRFTNLVPGGSRLYTFRLDHSSILGRLEQMFPAYILGGIQIELTLAPAEDAFVYNPLMEYASRQRDEKQKLVPCVFDCVDGMLLRHDEYWGEKAGKRKSKAKADGVEQKVDSETDGYLEVEARGNALTSDSHRTEFISSLCEYYGRPLPQGQSLEYVVSDFMFVVSAVYMDEGYTRALLSRAESDKGLSIFLDQWSFNRLTNEGHSIQNFTMMDSVQNLKSVLFGCVEKSTLNRQDLYSYDTFKPLLSKWNFRVGARSWQVIPNGSQAENARSYTETLLGKGMYDRGVPAPIRWQTWGRDQNVHSFSFQKVQDESHSGINLTDGKLLRLEAFYARRDEVRIPRAEGYITIQKGCEPSACVIFFYMYSTRLLHVSNKGIAISS